MEETDGRAARRATVFPLLLILVLLAFTALLPLARGDTLRWLGLRDVWALLGGGPDRFRDPFDDAGVLAEAGDPRESVSDGWWLNSGGYFVVEDGIGRTLAGELAETDPWFRRYATSNPIDSDLGYHPQNVFRLITRDSWRDVREEVRFRIRKLHPSESPQRAESNGVLLMARYRGKDDLYYAGLRVDGRAIVKKKVGGRYLTLAEKPVYANDAPYDRAANPILLPLERWIGLRTTVRNDESGGVFIRLDLREDDAAAWTPIIEVHDDGRSRGPGIT
ncbi:MAG: hypothetical protein ACREQ9_15555, partial [Candidatus Binatia bacterium]